jgi:hypothetical protein
MARNFGHCVEEEVSPTRVVRQSVVEDEGDHRLDVGDGDGLRVELGALLCLEESDAIGVEPCQSNARGDKVFARQHSSSVVRSVLKEIITQ